MTDMDLTPAHIIASLALDEFTTEEILALGSAAFLPSDLRDQPGYEKAVSLKLIDTDINTPCFYEPARYILWLRYSALIDEPSVRGWGTCS